MNNADLPLGAAGAVGIGRRITPPGSHISALFGPSLDIAGTNGWMLSCPGCWGYSHSG